MGRRYGRSRRRKTPDIATRHDERIKLTFVSKEHTYVDRSLSTRSAASRTHPPYRPGVATRKSRTVDFILERAVKITCLFKILKPNRIPVEVSI
jgi:hypothetical protein